MQCNDFEKRMQRLLDRRRRPELDAELTTHALLCGRCGEILETQSLLFDGLEHAVLPAAPRQLGPQVIRQYRGQQQHRVVGMPTRRWLPAVALAAALCLLAVMPVNRYFYGRPTVRQDAEVALAVSVPVPQTLGQQVGSSVEVEEGQGNAMTPSLLALQELSFGLPNSERLAMGLRPLTYTFSFAFDAFRRTFVAPFTEYDPTADAPDVMSLIL